MRVCCENRTERMNTPRENESLECFQREVHVSIISTVLWIVKPRLIFFVPLNVTTIIHIHLHSHKIDIKSPISAYVISPACFGDKSSSSGRFTSNTKVYNHIGFDSRWGHWDFSLTESFRPHYGPGVDSVSDRNECQRYFLSRKDGRCQRLTTILPTRADCLEILGTSNSWSPNSLSRTVMG